MPEEFTFKTSSGQKWMRFLHDLEVTPLHKAIQVQVSTGYTYILSLGSQWLRNSVFSWIFKRFGYNLLKTI